MNLGQLQEYLKTALMPMYEPGEALAIAEMVLERYTGKTRVQQKLDRSVEVNEQQIMDIETAKEQLGQHKPVQYILGEAWFLGLPFQVDKSVLIPRPETEELVMLAIENLGKDAISILDIGTGSGCIPISLQKRMSRAKITSIDVSELALRTATKNAMTHHASIQFQQVDFLNETSWPALPIFDAIISNPPYIPTKEKEKLDENVTQWEPGIALFVPNDDALLFYRKIALFGKKHLIPNGKIFVEIHQDYALATQQLFLSEGYDAAIKKDINGNDRMIVANTV